MSSRNKHPLPVGETVFPWIWINRANLGGLRREIEGKATINGPADKPHHYLVTFEGESEACERGPLDEFSIREELPL